MSFGPLTVVVLMCGVTIRWSKMYVRFVTVIDETMDICYINWTDSESEVLSLANSRGLSIT